MRRASTRLLLLAGALVPGAFAVAVPAAAQQQFCSGKVRHIECHFADGKLVTFDTDPRGEYYNIPPYMTFRTKDGLLHAIIGNCVVTCRP